ncbi:MAG: hypothetical protein K0Q55_1549 [Verrucomicrobia bacterium]|jgi:hypothetical protein|nr:hypothetical protein [Verrucomicrobiota bacterium]
MMYEPKETMKTLSLLCSLAFLLCLSACASKPQPPSPNSLLPQQSTQPQSPPQQLREQKQPQQKNTAIIGTWQWVLDNGNPVSHLFYVRYYPNGKIASWPSPKDWSDSKGVSHGRYSVADGFLFLGTGSGANTAKSRAEIQGQELIVTTSTGQQLVYRRINPAIEPGKLANGSPAGFAQH